MFDGLIQAFHEGGFWMWPILGCLIVSAVITVERVYALFVSNREDKDALIKGLNREVMKGDLMAMIRFLDAQPKGPLSRILKAGLQKIHRPDIEVQAALDEASLREVPKIEARTPFLAVLSNAATLLGLLGTIIGMIRSFAAVASADPAEKATLLAAGIAEAMNCTAFGLVTAIGALFAYAIVQARTQHLVDEINECVVTEINLVLGNRELFRNEAERAARAAKAS